MGSFGLYRFYMGRSKTKQPRWHVLKVHDWVYWSAVRLQARIVETGTVATLPKALRHPKRCPFCSKKLVRRKEVLRCSCGLQIPLEMGMPTLTTVLGLALLQLATQMPRSK